MQPVSPLLSRKYWDRAGGHPLQEKAGHPLLHSHRPLQLHGPWPKPPSPVLRGHALQNADRATLQAPHTALPLGPSCLAVHLLRLEGRASASVTFTYAAPNTGPGLCTCGTEVPQASQCTSHQPVWPLGRGKAWHMAKLQVRALTTSEVGPVGLLPPES